MIPFFIVKTSAIFQRQKCKLGNIMEKRIAAFVESQKKSKPKKTAKIPWKMRELPQQWQK